MSQQTPDELKELGNAAFAAKEYDQAIDHYTAAIRLDPKNNVFFSNRSASYGGLKDWANAASDAKECIRLEPSFVKGYYRLATAQIELKDWDGASATIKQGLNVDPHNPQLSKQLRQVNLAKKLVANKNSTQVSSQSVMVPGGAASKELQDLHQQFVQTNREYNVVRADIAKAQRELKTNELTKAELDTLPEESTSKMYRGVGKMFMLSSRSDVMESLSKSMEADTKRKNELMQKMDYLERKLKSQQQNMKELTQAPSSAE